MKSPFSRFFGSSEKQRQEEQEEIVSPTHSRSEEVVNIPIEKHST